MSDRELFNDVDPEETQEWLDALSSVIDREGHNRAHFLIEKLIDSARRSGAHIPHRPTTAYVNTILTAHEERSDGDHGLEWRIRSLIRWNALAMVVRANQKTTELGGHIASFASSATLYDVGFNHFWHAPNENHGGDLIFFQGHSAPGIYARAFLEGRLTEHDLENFRQEADGDGLSSYPHPRLMPEFWQFPTVSMGLGPIMAIYQARFMKYLHHRGILDTSKQKVWAFVGDGEMDEPESIGALSLAGREKLDNLIFVVNCNLQRLDGPVRGNGKIIQELEGDFRGSNWNVIKLIWGSYWDPLLMADTKGLLRKCMEETVDGDFQAFKAKGGAYTRERFFGKYEELKAMVSNMTDEDIWRLNRGGHDPHKVYAAYAAAVKHTGQPTVILAKTVKGYGMGEAGEGQNITHQQKKMGEDALMSFRDRFNIPLTDEEVKDAPFYRPPDDSPEIQYMRERRKKLGGSLPARRQISTTVLDIPDISIFDAQLKGTGKREISTTMGFVRILTALIRDKSIGDKIVPIVPDESRTFGMEGMYRQIGIYSPLGQLYEPEDADQLMYYKESKDGQVLQEGINEAGATCSWIAAGTAYSHHNVPMVPFYIFYSMFGFQRVGDLAWAAADIRTRGFLIGGTAGRTTLAGEGLQHQDGHSLIMAATVPSCVAYDPTYVYELAVIIHHGLKRMYVDREAIYFYITCMNENYVHPAMPEGAEEGIIKGMYKLMQFGDSNSKHRIQLLGGGTILREVQAAAEILETEFSVASDVWSVTSFNELARDGRSVARWNRLNPHQPPKSSYIDICLQATEGPIVAASDYIRMYTDQIREFVPRRYTVLGTDGYGRSDTRNELRKFFEVNRYFIATAALKALADDGLLDQSVVVDAYKKFNIDTDKTDPLLC